MIKLSRPALTPSTSGILARRQAKIDTADDPRAKAKASWRTFRGSARDEVAERLSEICSGIVRCMYCEDSLATDIDHYRPKAHFPEWAFRWDNYLLACSSCNSNLKRDAFPMRAGKALLIDPTTMDPAEHLALSLSTGIYHPRTDEGKASIEVFGLNRDTCTTGRRTAWTSLQGLIRMYVQHSTSRGETLAACTRFPFQGVRRTLILTIDSGDRAGVVPSDIKRACREFPQLTQ
ncbi:HNH endonuclease [Nocardia takedensis]